MSLHQRVHTTSRQTILYTISGVLAAAVAAFAISMSFAPAHAADKPNASTNTLKVSPVRTDIEVKPGSERTVQTIVTNITDKPITVHASSNDFVAGDEKGTPALILDENKYAPTHSLKRFMQPLKDVEIAPGDDAKVDVVIKVPADAAPGGYYGAVRFSPVDAATGGQVNISTSAASIILLRVPGKVVENISMTNFEVQQNATAGTYFSTPDHISLMTRFQNKGSVHEGPFGKVSVKKDNKVIYSADFNIEDPKEMVLPDSARRWTVPLKNIGHFGHYTVSATFSYGTSGKTIEASQSFWVIPTYIIISIVVGILVLIAVIVGVVVGLRRYKQNLLRTRGGGGGRGR